MIPLDSHRLKLHKVRKALRLAPTLEETRSHTTSKHSVVRHLPIRVVVQQRALPKYRIPVFGELAKREGIELIVVYDALTDGTLNSNAEGLRSKHVPLRIASVFGHPVYWHSAQWQYAVGDCCDVVILSWDLHYASLVPALVRARLNGVPAILWGHGYSKREAAWRKRLRRSVARLATALLFYSSGTAQSFITSGWDPDRVYLALNSLDQTPIQQARQCWKKRLPALEAFREQHDLATGPTILFVSRLLYENRVDLLLRAAAELSLERFRDLTIVLIGSGPDEARLKALANELGISARLRMPGAIYDEVELAPWFLSADVFCYPTNIGLSLLHAFGYGLPVVTSNKVDAQNPEIEALKDGDNGLLYQDGDPGSLAAALDRVLSDRGLREHMTRQALDTVTSRFTLSTMVDGMEQAVRFCAHKAAPR
ncbi:MAG: glycosyltransferase family 4 protein [Gammaproteobacteria bacterium]